MSLFQEQAVCESVNFFSHHIKPSKASEDGVLTLSSGASNETYSFVVKAEGLDKDMLKISSKHASVMDVHSDGSVRIRGDLLVDGKLPQQMNDATGLLADLKTQLDALNAIVQGY